MDSDVLQWQKNETMQKQVDYEGRIKKCSNSWLISLASIKRHSHNLSIITNSNCYE